jgi:DNA replication protein DnaC
VEDRERRAIELRMKDARLPGVKTLEEFDFEQSPRIPASRIRALVEDGYLERAEPVLMVGEPGTGKSHLATGVAIATYRQLRGHVDIQSQRLAQFRLLFRSIRSNLKLFGWVAVIDGRCE